MLEPGTAEPGRPTENHCAAAEPGTGVAETRALDLLKVYDVSILGAVSVAVDVSAAGTSLLTRGPLDSPTLGGSSVGRASSAFAKEGRQLGKLTASSADR